MFEAGKDYTVLVSEAYTTVSKKETPGVVIKFVDGDDDIYHTLWVTRGTRDNVKKTLTEAFGLPEDIVHSRDFWADPGVLLTGKKVRIKTKEDEYEGKSRVIVAYINPMKTSATPDVFLSVFEEKQDSLFPGTTPFD